MPKILKRFQRPAMDDYVFRPAEELWPGNAPDTAEDAEENDAAPEPEGGSEQEQTAETEQEPESEPEQDEASEAEKEIFFARVQAEAILADARRDMEAWKAEARQDFEAELDALREQAHQEGYDRGYAEGVANAREEGERQRREIVAQEIEELQSFLEQAAREKARLWDAAKDEMKDLAVAIAEKVIHVSLKNSADVLLRMVDAATERHKRCAWARIYVADCDLQGQAYTAPELADALGHIAERVRVVPMADDESGTCIVELPDVILDASVSTQISAIRDVLDEAALDKEKE